MKLPLDLNAVRLDLNNDGRTAEDESLGQIVAKLTAIGGDRRQTTPRTPWKAAFDRADV